MLHNKYYAIKILILICCINMDAMNQNVDTNTNNGVIIFSENNYQGTNTILKPGNYLISELQNIKSITIPNGLEVFLSNKDDFDDESAEKISCPSVDELKNNNSTEEYKLDNIDTSKYKYLYVLKVDLNNEDGIASHDEYDSNTGKYFGRHVSKVKEFSSTEKENLKEIVIDSSPDFQGLPDLTQYKNL
ncbi:MAG: hypothetical protein IJ848_01240 [Alphaproteobacteria bacterium]|nr:hypothetical protein [Alphaproteobacteria bacterium]